MADIRGLFSGLPLGNLLYLSTGGGGAMGVRGVQLGHAQAAPPLGPRAAYCRSGSNEAGTYLLGEPAPVALARWRTMADCPDATRPLIPTPGSESARRTTTRSTQGRKHAVRGYVRGHERGRG